MRDLAESNRLCEISHFVEKFDAELLQTYPELTGTGRKVCVLLKLISADSSTLLCLPDRSHRNRHIQFCYKYAYQTE